MNREEQSSGAQDHGKRCRKKRGAYPGGLEARAQQNKETNGDTPDIPEAPDSAPVTPEPDPEEQEWEEAERQRVADMTRTVQVSIEQILAAAEQEAAAPPPPEDPEPVTEPDHTVETLPQTLGRGAVKFGKWTLLVVCSVLLIAGAGIAWLWNGATETAIPEMTVTLDGEDPPLIASSC